ncbi:glycosyl transferase family 90 [Roseiarcaceae bacterium H3SJ34-1]|uniref:glycosyl transferase family 90 n=1 Tax=Terripilifer ovatus TaxID=3032367 RepID=UPI003AB9B00E|nr:glycosyl transferase family 90 [Roseiarcaceae bacterium H3SJ34-1]
MPLDETNEWATLTQRMAAAGLELGGFGFSPALAPEEVAFMTRAGGGRHAGLFPAIAVELSTAIDEVLGDFRGRVLHAIDLLAPYLASYAMLSPFALKFNMSDAGGAGALSFDRPEGSDWPLCPDMYLLELPTKAADINAGIDFRDRKPVVFWRGSTTGGGWFRSTADLLASYRVESCLRVHAALGERADCRISRIVQLLGPTEAEAVAALGEADVFADVVPESAFGACQMVLDLPGNAAAWGACFKYLAGCLVLKPPSGRELSYSHLLRPWTHYIPVARDMSDIADRVTWVDDHPDEAAAIAATGQAKMRAVAQDVAVQMLRAFEANNRTGELR